MTLRLSTYDTYIPNPSGSLLLYNSLTGGMDEVIGEPRRALLKARQNGGMLAPESLLPATRDALVAQGHITRWTRQEELEHHNARARVLSRELVAKSHVNLCFLLTYSCNFECNYCFQRTLRDVPAGRVGFISPALVDTVFAETLRQLNDGDHTINKIVIIGGEPLQAKNRPAIERILKHGAVHGTIVSISSNGYEADQFLELFGKGPGKIEKLLCTLDGPARIHDRSRILRNGKGTFAKIVSNLIRISDLGVDISIHINLSSESLDSLNELTDELTSIGLLGRENVELIGNPVYPSPMEASSTCIPGQLSVWKMEQMLAQRGLDKDIMSLPIYLKRRLREEIFDNPYARPRSVCGCTISNPTDITIDPYADLYACYLEAGYLDKRIGTVRPGGSVDIFERYRTTANMQVHLSERCQECPIALICGGGCWAYYEKDDDNYYQTFCPNMRKMVMKAILDIHSEMLAGSYENEKIVPYKYPHCGEITGLWRACDPPADQAA